MQFSFQLQRCRLQQRLPNLHKFQLPPDGRQGGRGWGRERLPAADYWSCLLYEDWPETCFWFARPITSEEPTRQAKTSTSGGSIIMGSGALQLCRPININAAGGGGSVRPAVGKGAAYVAYAYAASIYAIYCLRWHSMGQAESSQVPLAKLPGWLGPPVVGHLPFGIAKTYAKTARSICD